MNLYWVLLSAARYASGFTVVGGKNFQAGMKQKGYYYIPALLFCIQE
jgi:hypothetical protein